jgi:hypothetical protein
MEMIGLLLAVIIVLVYCGYLVIRLAAYEKAVKLTVENMQEQAIWDNYEGTLRYNSIVASLEVMTEELPPLDKIKMRKLFYSGEDKIVTVSDGENIGLLLV